MFRDLFYGRIEFQGRPEWYQVVRLVSYLGGGVAELGLSPKDFIHVGGTAAYLRGRVVFGDAAVTGFRGTEDVDIVSFNPGGFNFLLNHLRDTGKIERFSRHPSHFPDKKVYDVTLPKGNQVGVNNTIAVDLYAGQNQVRFNSRVMTPDCIVLDPPELLSDLLDMGGDVAVPSLQDMFFLKMDVVDTSEEGLRDKDEMDLLWILSMAERTGQDFMDYVSSMVQDDRRRYPLYRGTSKKLDALDGILEVAASDVVKNPEAQGAAKRVLGELRTLRKQGHI